MELIHFGFDMQNEEGAGDGRFEFLVNNDEVSRIIDRFEPLPHGQMPDGVRGNCFQLSSDGFEVLFSQIVLRSKQSKFNSPVPR